MRTVCAHDGCPARAWNGPVCSKHDPRNDVSTCDQDGCDNTVYLDGQCITCKFPLT
jgi:hypothetical protein